MHELSIASNIIDAMRAFRKERALPAITAVGIRVGTLSDIVPDSLNFGFEILTRDTEFAATRLDIERVLPSGRCRKCDTTFTVHELLFVCDKCQSADVELICGQELEIVYFEFDESGAPG